MLYQTRLTRLGTILCFIWYCRPL